MYSNGELIEDVVRTSFNAASFKEVYEGVLSPEALQKAIDAIDFAETELQNLAIEFAKFCGKKCFYSEQRATWLYDKIQYTTETLFTKFIEQRKTI